MSDHTLNIKCGDDLAMEMVLEKKGKDRVGEISKNRFGSEMEIIEYRKYSDITVRFIESGYVKSGVGYGEFKRGRVSNPYDKSIFGVGYIGEGDYPISVNGVKTSAYSTWYSMMARCYNPKFQKKHPTYKGCKVHPDWHSYQEFAKYFEKNYYEIDGKASEIDKDILIRGNKIYSPDTCVFVPKVINTLFINRKAKRGSLPIGVSYHNQTGKFQVHCGIGTGDNRKQKCLGVFDTKEEAFEAYKKRKLDYIKEVADDWYDRGIICGKLRTAMHSYTISITD